MIDDPHGPLYTLVCTDTNPYGTWQSEFLEHTWHQAGIPGELVRLVGAPDGGDLPRHHYARVVRTSATNTHPRMRTEYAGINRLYSLGEWLERERPVGTVLILDCDMLFRAPLDRRAVAGTPIGQWWYDFGLGGHWTETFDAVSPGIVERVQPVTWPMLIHTSDLRPLMPRWLDLTARLRQLTDAWESDMMALTIVLAERDLRCDLEMVAAWTPWSDDVVGDAPIVHYCQPLLDKHGEVLWFKQFYRPWDELGFDPDDAELGYGRDMLHLLDRYARLRRAADAYQSG